MDLGATRRKLKRRVVGLLGVIGANMGFKLLVALRLEDAHHFTERCAGRRSRSFEAPATFGATKTSKTLLLNPYELPAHGEPILQVPIWMVCRASYGSGRAVKRLISGFWFWSEVGSVKD